MTGGGDEAFPRHTQNSAKGKSCCWRVKETEGGVVGPKFPKRWRKKAQGGPQEGWIRKTALDELGDGIMVPESGSHAHTRRCVILNPSEKISA